MFGSLGLLLGLSVIFHIHGAHVVRATTLCHFDIFQLGALRFVAVRRNAMLGSWGIRKTQVRLMAVCGVITPFNTPEWAPVPLRPLRARHLGASLAGT
jgi:hypothetical protein